MPWTSPVSNVRVDGEVIVGVGGVVGRVISHKWSVAPVLAVVKARPVDLRLCIPTHVDPDWSKAMRIHSQRFHYGWDLVAKLIKPITVAQKMTKVIAAFALKEQKTEARPKPPC